MESSGTSSVQENGQPMVSNVIQGGNARSSEYGQIRAKKEPTMQGELGADATGGPSEHRGLAPRVFQQVLQVCLWPSLAASFAVKAVGSNSQMCSLSRKEMAVQQELNYNVLTSAAFCRYTMSRSRFCSILEINYLLRAMTQKVSSGQPYRLCRGKGVYRSCSTGQASAILNNHGMV